MTKKKTPGTLGYEWAYIMWPPNMRGRRDIPDGALLHDSLLRRLKSKEHSYRPTNNRGDNSPPCLAVDKFALKQADKGVHDSRNVEVEPPGIHDIYTLKY